MILIKKRWLYGGVLALDVEVSGVFYEDVFGVFA